MEDMFVAGGKDQKVPWQRSEPGPCSLGYPAGNGAVLSWEDEPSRVRPPSTCLTRLCYWCPSARKEAFFDLQAARSWLQGFKGFIVSCHHCGKHHVVPADLMPLDQSAPGTQP